MRRKQPQLSLQREAGLQQTTQVPSALEPVEVALELEGGCVDAGHVRSEFAVLQVEKNLERNSGIRELLTAIGFDLPGPL